MHYSHCFRIEDTSSEPTLEKSLISSRLTNTESSGYQLMRKWTVQNQLESQRASSLPTAEFYMQTKKTSWASTKDICLSTNTINSIIESTTGNRCLTILFNKDNRGSIATILFHLQQWKSFSKTFAAPVSLNSIGCYIVSGFQYGWNSHAHWEKIMIKTSSMRLRQDCTNSYLGLERMTQCPTFRNNSCTVRHKAKLVRDHRHNK
ncbi:hypothetical protein PROFUN_16929 [Planoprotostelium fungivorum]|uniref:Uncharacterized protein n=1 Tax=Planoprotostelium fungivorum TaxID=1890364 RepID=A0A2P6MNH3_9EUKA|nr:hypothetical protein PROFUN_16929 [Planoprotostelium fungivorum]